MLFIVILSQTLLYLCFAITLGSFILYLIPANYRPTINVSKRVLLLAISGIAILSFFPVLQIILYLTPKLGFEITLEAVLLTYEVGKSWLMTLVLASILFIVVVCYDYKKKAYTSYIGIAISLMLIFTIGWSGHASTINHFTGVLSHTLHFTAVSVWVGILIVISWFSKDDSNWSNLLKWFTPVAIACFTATILTGLILMNFAMELRDYPDTWLVPYGQSLLIKHVLIIPLMIYAVVNGLIIRNKLNKDSSFNPIAWTRMESIVILLIFSATAALGQQSPPQEIKVTNEELSPLFKLFYQGQFQPNMTVQLFPNATSIFLLVLAILFFALMMISYMKKAPSPFSLLMSVLLAFSLYLSVMLSIG